MGRVVEGMGVVPELYGDFGTGVGIDGLVESASTDYAQNPCSLGDCPTVKVSESGQAVYFGDTLNPEVEATMPRSMFKGHLLNILRQGEDADVDQMLSQTVPPLVDQYSQADKAKLLEWMLDGYFDDHAGLEDFDEQAA